jgi:hypothetical protein
MKSVWKFFLLCIGFTVIGVFMILDGEGLSGWFVTLLFGLGTLVFGAQFWPAASYLKLTPKGFVCCTLFRNWSAEWEAVSDFHVGKIGDETKVIFQQHGARGLKFLPDSYGRTLEELAELMNEWRRRGIGSN